MVEGWANALVGADVETGCWVAAVADLDRNGSALGVRVLHGRVREVRCKGVGCWCDAAHLVGDGARVGLLTVVSGAESEAAPAVGGSRPVDHVVGGGAAVCGDASVEVEPSVGGDAHSVGGRRRAGCVEREGSELAGDVAGDGELVGRRSAVGHAGRWVVASGHWGVNARFGVNTDGSPLVLGAVVDENHVHSGAVIG